MDPSPPNTSAAVEPRDAAGRYCAGNSGNRRGRPRRTVEEAALVATVSMARAVGGKVVLTVDLSSPTDRLPRAA